MTNLSTRRPRILAILLSATTLGGASNLSAQVQRPSIDELQRAMEQLDWMTGDWQGSGWIDTVEHGRREFSYVQSVSSRIDGLALLVEGVGSAKDDGAKVYEALRIVQGPPPAVLPGPPGTYAWHEFSRAGLLYGNEAQGAGRSLQVGLPIARQDCDRIVDDSWRAICQRGGEPVWSRRTITLSDDDRWTEIHEYQRVERNSDRTWVPFLEVVLHRVDPQEE